MVGIVVPDGISFRKEFIVSDDHCISRIDSTMPSVLATFVIVEWMEIASAMAVMPYLSVGSITVGTRIDVEHLAIAVPGSSVVIEAAPRGGGGRGVVFDVIAVLREKTISRAVHHRAVLPVKVIQYQITREVKYNEPGL